MAQTERGSDDLDPIFVEHVELFDVLEGVEVFDIQVDRDHSFIVAGVVVHNSEICQARDGMVFPVDSGPRPPAHIGCRSSTTPILRSAREMGISLPDAPPSTRASLDGQVPATTTYGEWLRARPAAEQDEILGVTKGRLFRAGGVDVRDFVDTRGKVYTLAELRTRDEAAFARAGL